MKTVNERLLEEEIAHAIGLQQYGNGIVRRILALLNRVDSDLFAQLSAALDTMAPASFTVQRLEGLLGSVRQLNAQAYELVGAELANEMRNLVEYEAGFQFQLFRSTIPPQVIGTVGLNAVEMSQVYAAAMARPFQGRLLAEWSRSIEADRMARIRDSVRMGFIENQTTSQIVQRVRGTRAKGYSDGIIEIDRRNAESVVRTAISHTAGFTRDRFMESNEDLIKAESWVSTLDTRTTHLCRVRDGLKYTPGTHKPIGHKVPWLSGPGRIHWACRSCSAPVTRSWKELGIDIEEMSPSDRSSMDGTVPAETSYSQWLARQSAARQDQILGPVRGKLLRQGGLTVDKFSNDRGQWLTLDELRERDAAAFGRAGL